MLYMVDLYASILDMTTEVRLMYSQLMAVNIDLSCDDVIREIEKFNACILLVLVI